MDKTLGFTHVIYGNKRGHSGAVVTHSLPTSEVSGLNPGPLVGKLTVAYQSLTVYTIELYPTVCTDLLYP